MTIIYVVALPVGVCMRCGHGSRDILGCALADDGTVLAEHLSTAAFVQHDMGLTSQWQHEHYRQHAPEGYTLEWVDEPRTHAAYQAAFQLNTQQRAQAEAQALELVMAAAAVDRPWWT